MSAKLPTIEEQDEPSKTSLTKANTSSKNLKSSKTSANQLISSKSSQNNKTNDIPNKKVTPQKISTAGPIINHVKNANVTLTEDCFGIYHDQDGKPTKVQRFTWRNNNNVQVQVITYGARILSVKTPDNKGILDDIVLGFSDLAGYVYYCDLFYGAIIGRVTNKIKNGTFQIDDKQYKVNCNTYTEDYADGGFCGLDKMLWKPCVNGTKVVLSCTLPDHHEGFPGCLVVQVTYELSPNNDFSISMEARTTKPTVINLSNLCYFNLGGHYAGPQQLYQHSVTINANCYTPMDEQDIPTGEIMNVVHTKFDFMTPKLMKNYLGVEPDDGFDQNLCINRGTGQKNCLVARVVHVKNGRILEVYSDQYGVRFDTANNWGTGVLSPPTQYEEMPLHRSLSYEDGDFFLILHELHEKMTEISSYDEENFKEVHGLLMRMNKMHKKHKAMPLDEGLDKLSFMNPDFYMSGFLAAIATSISQVKNCIPANIENITDWSELKLVANDLLDKYQQLDEGDNLSNNLVELEEQVQNFEDILEVDESLRRVPSLSKNVEKSRESILKRMTDSINRSRQSFKDKSHQSLKDESHQSVKDKSHQSFKDKSLPSLKDNQEGDAKDQSRMSSKPSVRLAAQGSTERFRCESLQATNVIPSFYKDGRIHGKNNAIYKRHGAMALQTQNYPDSVHHSEFPSSILKPGQIYKHNVVYKFWAQGNGLKKLKTKRKC